MLYKKYHRSYVKQFKKGAKVRFLIAKHDLVNGKFFTISELRINYGVVDVIFVEEKRVFATIIDWGGRLKTRTIELVY